MNVYNYSCGWSIPFISSFSVFFFFPIYFEALLFKTYTFRIKFSLILDALFQNNILVLKSTLSEFTVATSAGQTSN